MKSTNRDTIYYCLKKNEHRFYTQDLKAFYSKIDELGKVGMEYGIFRQEEDAIEYLCERLGENERAALLARIALEKEQSSKEARDNRREIYIENVNAIHEKKFFAVAKGWHQKICLSWEEALDEIYDFDDPDYIGCDTIEEAAAYVKEYNRSHKTKAA